MEKKNNVIYCKSYNDFVTFREWCMANNPKIVNWFTKPHINKEEWEQRNKNKYKQEKTHSFEFNKKYPSCQSYVEVRCPDYTSAYRDDSKYCDAVRDWFNKNHKYIIYKTLTQKDITDDYEYPICYTNRKIRQYLLWHCPIPYIREYLTLTAGLKTRWYHKWFLK